MGSQKLFGMLVTHCDFEELQRSDPYMRGAFRVVPVRFFETRSGALEASRAMRTWSGTLRVRDTVAPFVQIDTQNSASRIQFELSRCICGSGVSELHFRNKILPL